MTEDTAAAMAPVAQATQDHVTVCMPAEGAYLSVLRTATAGLAARLDFTLDEIEDLRIAVDEACALLLEHTSHLGEELHAAFTIHPQALDVVVRRAASVAGRSESRRRTRGSNSQRLAKANREDSGISGPSRSKVSRATPSSRPGIGPCSNRASAAARTPTAVCAGGIDE